MRGQRRRNGGVCRALRRGDGRRLYRGCLRGAVRPAREVNRLRESDLSAAAALAARLKQLAGLLGVLQLEPEAFLQAGAEGKVDAAEVEALIQARLEARAAKNWAESDRIRDQLTAMGVVLEDGKGGTTWRLAD
ncbi:CysS/YqeB C-terminal domain-containing protein [Pseudomonas aeruginosa]|uniref:CysS/YqeB C-terminal domain-containing protein n=1 Tax=Pseudomonas aeruginosa TaxID=287 RepID=UPI003D7FA631